MGKVGHVLASVCALQHVAAHRARLFVAAIARPAVANVCQRTDSADHIGQARSALRGIN
jgi:hypothetical protein